MRPVLLHKWSFFSTIGITFNIKSEFKSMKRKPLFTLSSMITAMAITLCLLLQYGYSIGASDSSELMPYALKMQDPSLYKHDFFLSFLSSHEPNFRSTFASLISRIGSPSFILIFVFHLLTSLLLVMGLDRLASLHIRNSAWRFAALFFALILYPYWALGAHQFYYPFLVSSGLACALAPWALLFFIRMDWFRASLLLGIITLLHGSVGLSLFLALSLTLLILRKGEWLRSFKLSLNWILPFTLTGGISLLRIFMNRESSDDSSRFFDIYFAFRNVHHYFIEARPLIYLLPGFVLWALSLMFLYRKKAVFYFILASSGLMFIYFFGVEYLHAPLIASLQLYTLSPWLLFFGWLSLFSIAEDILLTLSDAFDERIKPILRVLVVFLILDLFLLRVSREEQLFTGNIMIHSNEEMKDPELTDIYKHILQETPKDALFVYPPDLSSFKFFSRRSSYVDFKQVIPDAQWCKEWEQRARLIYGIDIYAAEKGFTAMEVAREFFESQSSTVYPSNLLQAWKKVGITHVLRRRQGDISPDCVLANSEYEVILLH